MESLLLWFIFFLTISIIITVLKSLPFKRKKLPPGPLTIPILSNLQWLCKSFADLEPILGNLRSKYGPIFTLHIGRRKAIFITSPNLAYQALIQKGAAFADRPSPPETTKFVTSHQFNISTAPYGSLWRLFRRKLTSLILHPSPIKSYSPTRKWVMEGLKDNLKTQPELGQLPIRVVDHFQYAMFCLLVPMCFGEKLNDNETSIKEIEVVQRALSLSFNRFNILNVFPKLGKILFRNRWNELNELRSNQLKVLLPLIRARQAKQKLQQLEKLPIVAYVDTLLNLDLPDELGGRKLEEHEIVALCSEFLTAGTDTTTSALQWIMANLVKHQDIQSKLFDEIKTVIKTEDDEIKEEDLQKMPYLQAVVLEGLRRHPPSHFVLPHAVTEDICLDGYIVPKDAMVNFMVAEIGWDPKLWEDPLEFRPERFMSGEGFDITGSRDIKMMLFGAGRRICPGLSLAMLHLEYFVANLVREFEWTARIGDDVDLSEKQEFTVVMKNPLLAHISPRTKG